MYFRYLEKEIRNPRCVRLNACSLFSNKHDGMASMNVVTTVHISCVLSCPHEDKEKIAEIFVQKGLRNIPISF